MGGKSAHVHKLVSMKILIGPAKSQIHTRKVGVGKRLLSGIKISPGGGWDKDKLDSP